MAYTRRTWVDQVDEVDASNFNDLEGRINSAVSSAVSAISNSQGALSGTVKLSGAGAVNVGTQTGNAFTISAPAQSVQTQSVVRAISGSDATFDQTVRVTGGPNVTVGTDASGLSISGGAQSVQTQSLVGAISNSQASRSGTVNLSGAGIVNVGTQTGNAFTISASQSLQTQSLVRAISASDATFDQTVRITGGPNITVGTDAQGLSISGPAAAGAGTSVAAISASDAVFSSGTVKITGSNQATVKTGAGQAVVIDVTTADQSVQTQSNVQGVVASNTTYRTGDVVFTGSNQATVKSAAGQKVVVDVTTAAQSVQTQNLVRAVSASDATFDQTVGITGAGDITVATDANGVVVSGSQSVQPAQTGISSVVASDTTYTSGQVQITGSNMVTVKSGAGQKVVIDATQSVQPAQTGISSIAASDTTYTSGQVEFTGSNAATVKSSANQRVVIDVPTQTTQPVGSLDLAGNTAGTMATLPLASNVELAGGNNITLSQHSGNSSSRITISGPNTVAQSVQPGVQHLVASDNTFSSGTVSVTGTGGGVTVNTAASKIQVSVAAPVAQTTQPGVQHLVASDNTFSSGTVSVTGAGEGITVNTAASKIQISGAQTGVKHLVASDNTFSSGTVSITGTGGGVTVNTAASKIQVSVAAQTVQPVGSQSQIGNTTGTTANLPFASNIALSGGNNVTLSQSSGTASTAIGISVPNTSAQTVQPGVQNLVASDNTFSSGTVSITGTGGGVTVNTAASKVQISVAAQTTQPVGSLSLSGNTAGTMANLPFASNIVLSAAGGATLSQSSGASSSIVQLSVHTSQSVQPGIQNFVASDNTFSSGTVSLTGAGEGITVNTAASKIQISHSQTAVKHLVASDNTFSSGTVSITGAGDITVNTAASKIQISGTQTVQTQSVNPKQHMWQAIPNGVGLGGISHFSVISKTPFYFPVTFDGDMTLNSVGVRLSGVTTNSIQSFSIHFGLYTLANSTSANLLASASNSYNVSSNSTVSWSAGRDWILTSPSSVAGISNVTAGVYIMGLMFSGAATQSANFSLVGASANATGVQPIGIIAPGDNQLTTATSGGLAGLFGQGSTTVNAMPAAVSAPDLRNQGTATLPIVPAVFIRS